MVSPRYRSRSLRKVYVRTPSGETKVHYRYKKPKVARCSCGALLKGIPRERPYKMINLAKSKKKNARPFGGNLCSKCMREEIISRVRKE